MARNIFIIVFIAILSVINMNLSAKAEIVPMTTVKELIVKHSIEMGIDPAIALSIAKKESGYCHNKKSKYGAVGVFQLMPSTAKKMGYNPYYIQDNIKGGITYYKMMYQMFGSMELALAAYNAGPGNVKKYNGIPPFKETKNFVSSIMNSYKYLKSNPDPVIAQYKSSEKEISFRQEIQETQDDFRMQQEAILQMYLSTQGI